MSTRTLSEIATLLGASLEGDGSRPVVGLGALGEAGPTEISFLANPRYRAQLETTRAAAVIVADGVAPARRDLALLRCADPNRAWTEVIRMFVPVAPPPTSGVHASAVVEAGARVDPSACIGPQCHVGSGAEIGARSVLRGQVWVGRDARIGADCDLHPGVVVHERVELGARCVVQPGAVLGSDGFGFEPTAQGWVKIPQCGTVVVEDDVEIGANACIDRARFGATRIGRGVKIDNLVHVAHNVQVGAGSMLIAQVGIAGSARLGRGVIVAGQAGVSGHVVIGDRARIAGGAGVTVDVEGGRDYMGTPARPRVEWLRMLGHMTRAAKQEARVRELERRLSELEQPRGVPEPRRAGEPEAREGTTR
jgi:UDP-3-O-[3-hydroxymyristoyl] glucosamine N-acyltransferase